MGADNNDSTLSDEQLLALASVLDLIIPASDDGRLPGAGQLGLSRYVCEHAVESLAVVTAGLSALDAIATSRGACGFAALPAKDAVAVLGEIDASQPAFLPTVIFHTYSGYYQDPHVIAALGLAPGPPFPGGYEVAPSDLSILERVRRLPKLYRE